MSIDRILTARDLATRDRLSSHQQWIEQVCRSRQLIFKPQPAGVAVLAFVDFGRWLAVCPDCGAPGYVDPVEQIFYCPSCGNEANQGHARPVQFPANRETIEAELLLRQVVERGGEDPLQRAILSTPVLPGLSRCWRPGETVDDLRQQHEEATATWLTNQPSP